MKNVAARLPNEILALIHYVELNEAGWWEKTVDRLITAVLWLQGDPLTISEISAHLKSLASINIDTSMLEAAARRLEDNDFAVRLADSRLRITENARRLFSKEVHEIEETESQARQTFISLIQTGCPSLNVEETWKAFHKDLLLPAIQELGARSYELITGQTKGFEQFVGLSDFLKQYAESERSCLRNAIVAFLDPKDASIREYILMHLNAYFCLAAGSLPRQTLERLNTKSPGRQQLRVFVDTNFLLSILDLHDNPSNDAAQALVKLVGQIAKFVDMRLYVLAITVMETRDVLEAHYADLRAIRVTPNIAKAAVSDRFSGITQKFLIEANKAGGMLDMDAYFRPYRNDLTTVMRGVGVEVFNEKLDSFRTREDVLDDISEQLEFERKRFNPGTQRRPKSYESVEHDMVLWHFIRDKRPALVESPLDAIYWAVMYRLGLSGHGFATQAAFRMAEA